VRRLDLSIPIFDDDDRDLYEIPEARGWLGGLLAVYPWLPVWLDTRDGLPGQVLATRVEGDIRESAHVTAFLLSAVQTANYAVALSRRLGADNLDHVYEFLELYGINDVPPGYFDGVDELGDELDDLARVTG
jgi:hypothetical protein